ncbi:rab-GTPase-TBC domain-containing protein [Melampsora americana]|nr:rab-GTPase-TBC domain-containing protein [Melampsora americana]
MNSAFNHHPISILFNQQQQQQQPINLRKLQGLLLNHGIPDHPNHLRPIIWSLLLNLTSESNPQKQLQYNELMSYLIQQIDIHNHSNLISTSSSTDHSNQSSQRDQINQTLSSIDADVRRTQANLTFFSSPMKASLNSSSGVKLHILINQLNRLGSLLVLNLLQHPSTQSFPTSSVHHIHKASQSADHHESDSYQTSCTTTTSSPFDENDESAFSPTHTTHTERPDQDHAQFITLQPKLDPIITFSEYPAQPTTPLLNIQAPSPICSDILTYTFHDCLTRLLYVWSMLNPGVGYVQGMNELGALILYVFGQTKSQQVDHEDESKHDLLSERVEADAFWAFTTLMSTVRDIFVQSLDTPLPSTLLRAHRPSSPLRFTEPIQFSDPIPKTGQQVGIGRLLGRYGALLKWLHPLLSDHLALLGVDPTLYAFNWFTCLFTHCFNLADVIRLWDPLLTLNFDPSSQSQHGVANQEEMMDFLVDIACALTLQLGPTILNITSFASAIKLLQGIRSFRSGPGFPSLDVDSIVQDALLIRQRRLAEGFATEQATNQPNSQLPPVPETEEESTLIGHQDQGAFHLPGLSNALAWTSLQRYKSKSATNLGLPLPSSPTNLRPRSMDHLDGAVENNNGGLLEKLKTRAEAWKDSDTAATFSKQATNWTILASSWRPPTIVSKLSSLSTSDPPSPSTPASQHSAHQSPHETSDADTGNESFLSSTRWSRLSSSSSSTVSVDPIHSPPSTGSLGSPIAASSVTMGSSQGPRPLLLSSRARTTVVTQSPTPSREASTGGLLSELSSSWKKISGSGGGGNAGVNSFNHPQSPIASMSSQSPLPVNGVKILGRSRSPSMFSPPQLTRSPSLRSRNAEYQTTPTKKPSSRHSLPDNPFTPFHHLS